MSIILNIETATPVCSIALSDNNQILALRETSEKNSHSQVVAVFIDEILKDCGLKPADLDAVAVSKGPGSYTGLRIGVSTAKGICYALGKPLISVGTLKAMALGMSLKFRNPETLPVLFAPMIDARRMEVYTALYDQNLIAVKDVYAAIVDKDTFSDFIENHIICFAGDGAEKAGADDGYLGGSPRRRSRKGLGEFHEVGPDAAFSRKPPKMRKTVTKVAETPRGME